MKDDTTDGCYKKFSLVLWFPYISVKVKYVKMKKS